MANDTHERSVSASEFARNFGRYRDEAAADGLVEVTSHGRVIGAFVSARQLEEFRRMKRHQAENLQVGDLPDDVVTAIEDAEYGKAP